jgi:hypothetical protein
MTNINVPDSVSQSRPSGIRYTVRRSDLDNAIAAIELALEYLIELGDFDLSFLTDMRDRLVVARDSLVFD